MIYKNTGILDINQKEICIGNKVKFCTIGVHKKFPERIVSRQKIGFVENKGGILTFDNLPLESRIGDYLVKCQHFEII